MKQKIWFFACLLMFSCNERKDLKDNAAEKALKDNVVFVDGTNKIIHWNKSCNRAVQKIMVLREIDELIPDVEFCSCVPVDKMKEIKDKM